MLTRTRDPFKAVLSALFLVGVFRPSKSFIVPRTRVATSRTNPRTHTTDPLESPFSSPSIQLHESNRFGRDFEEAANRRAAEKRAAGGGMGETAAGAILGGLVMGPFGALFGAQLGANFGAARATDQAKKEEMERMGITPDMLAMAEESGLALEKAVEGLEATRDSLETQKSFARRLDRDVEQIYERAKAAMAASDEDTARDLLMQRQALQQKLKRALQACAEAKQRLDVMEANVEVLEGRAMEVEALLRRSVGARALQETSTQFSLSSEDPLLKKFKDLGID